MVPNRCSLRKLVTEYTSNGICGLVFLICCEIRQKLGELKDAN